jgi:hypothetical protein
MNESLNHTFLVKGFISDNQVCCVSNVMCHPNECEHYGNCKDYTMTLTPVFKTP